MSPADLPEIDRYMRRMFVSGSLAGALLSAGFFTKKAIAAVAILPGLYCYDLYINHHNAVLEYEQKGRAEARDWAIRDYKRDADLEKYRKWMEESEKSWKKSLKINQEKKLSAYDDKMTQERIKECNRTVTQNGNEPLFKNGTTPSVENVHSSQSNGIFKLICNDGSGDKFNNKNYTLHDAIEVQRRKKLKLPPFDE